LVDILRPQWVARYKCDIPDVAGRRIDDFSGGLKRHQLDVDAQAPRQLTR